MEGVQVCGNRCFFAEGQQRQQVWYGCTERDEKYRARWVFVPRDVAIFSCRLLIEWVFFLFGAKTEACAALNLFLCIEQGNKTHRTIFDAVRTIDDILEFTERYQINGLLVAIDFQKAFDSIQLIITLCSRHSLFLILGRLLLDEYKFSTKIFPALLWITVTRQPLLR